MRMTDFSHLDGPGRQGSPAPVATDADVIAAFRGRVESIVKAGAGMRKRRQAVALAVETSMSPEDARRALSTMPTDDVAGIAHGASLAPGGVGQEGPPVAKERKRVAGILNSDEAEGREDQALAFALSDVLEETARALLGRTPRSSSGGIDALVERQRGLGEFGAQPEVGAARGGVDALWAEAVDRVNASMPKPPPAPEVAENALAAPEGEERPEGDAATAEDAWRAAISRANG